MFEKSALISALQTQKALDTLAMLYGKDEATIKAQSQRYAQLLDTFIATFGTEGNRPCFFSSPGRTEIIGNHTDHNNGLVLAAAVTLDALALVAPTHDGIITLYSKGFDQPFVVNTSDLDKNEDEVNTTFALIRGVCAKLSQMGYQIGGFNACVTSNVFVGSGLSSSAAFEVLLVSILDGLYNSNILDGVVRAKIAQWVENNFFGKPCGLMDQSACSIGGLVAIDFKNADPKIQAHNYDFAAQGFSVVVLATHSSHDDLTQHYAAIPAEMKAVAKLMGGQVLRDFKLEDVLANAAKIRQEISDRALMRALHYYDENQRVKDLTLAIDQGDLDGFLANVIASGQSSWKLLQNLYVCGSVEQSLALACTLSQRILEGCGAWRVHGGGFAGTILAFVPNYKLQTYISMMDSVFGEGSALVLGIRSCGATMLDI